MLICYHNIISVECSSLFVLFSERYDCGRRLKFKRLIYYDIYTYNVLVINAISKNAHESKI